MIDKSPGWATIAIGDPTAPRLVRTTEESRLGPAYLYAVRPRGRWKWSAVVLYAPSGAPGTVGGAETREMRQVEELFQPEFGRVPLVDWLYDV